MLLVLLACCLLLLLLLLAKMCCSSLDPNKGVEPRQGKPSSVIKTQTGTELGPSLGYRAGFTLSRFYTTF